MIGFHDVQHLFLSLHSHLIRVNIISKSDFAYYFVKENWTGEREEVIGKSCVTSIEIGCTFTTDQDTRQQQFFLSFETFPSSKEKFRRPSSFLFAGLQTMRKKNTSSYMPMHLQRSTFTLNHVVEVVFSQSEFLFYSKSNVRSDRCIYWKVKELELFHHRYCTALWRFYISAIGSPIEEFYTPVLSQLILKEISCNR